MFSRKGKTTLDSSQKIRNWLSGIIVYDINKKVEIAGFKISFSARSKDNLWGRFGGGWNWKLGIQVGGRTVIISLLIADLVISKIKKDETR